MHADVDLRALGRPLQAMVAVRLQAGRALAHRRFQAYLAGLPGVLNVFCLSRADDFQVHVAVQTPDRLRDFVVDHLSASADVTMTETSLIFENVGA